MASLLSALREVFRAPLLREGIFERGSAPWRLTCTDAEDRARRLLITALSPLQRAQFLAAGHFEVVGCHTGRRYRILHSSQMNVERLDSSGQRVELLCFVPETPVPVGDVMLAQKFALELYEIDALNLANRYPAPGRARRHLGRDGAL